jgi:hypothetical protein
VTESRERRRELRLLQQAIEEANVGLTSSTSYNE